MELMDAFGIIGAPARAVARILLFLRYILYGYSALNSWSRNEYVRARFGLRYKWRLWLLSMSSSYSGLRYCSITGLTMI